MSCLFSAERLPRKPYCSDNKTASRIRPLNDALKCAYIQFNPPGMMHWMIFDIDDKKASSFGNECDWRIAPSPNMIIANPANGHAHYVYCLSAPVCMTDKGRDKPKRYAKASRDGLSAVLGADMGYTGLLSKNPLHPSHNLTTLRNEPYDLAELAEYADMEKGKAWRRAHRQAVCHGKGDVPRNCTLFRALSLWAYSSVLAYKERGDLAAWESACLFRAEAMNSFPAHSQGNLSFSEVRGIARSVSTWTWRTYTGRGASDPEFLELQALRGRLNGARRRNEFLPQARDLAEAGMGQREMASLLGVSQKTISNWLKRDSV